MIKYFLRNICIICILSNTIFAVELGNMSIIQGSIFNNTNNVENINFYTQIYLNDDYILKENKSITYSAHVIFQSNSLSDNINLEDNNLDKKMYINFEKLNYNLFQNGYEYSFGILDRQGGFSANSILDIFSNNEKATIKYNSTLEEQHRLGEIALSLSYEVSSVLIDVVFMPKISSFYDRNINTRLWTRLSHTLYESTNLEFYMNILKNNIDIGSGIITSLNDKSIVGLELIYSTRPVYDWMHSRNDLNNRRYNNLNLNIFYKYMISGQNNLNIEYGNYATINDNKANTLIRLIRYFISYEYIYKKNNIFSIEYSTESYSFIREDTVTFSFTKKIGANHQIDIDFTNFERVNDIDLSDYIKRKRVNISYQYLF